MIRFSLLLLVVSAFPFGCSPSPAGSKSKSPSEAPAKVEKLPVETEIGRITLTSKAEQRLGITITKVVKQVISNRRVFGGDVMIPLGKSIVVSAPYPGKIVPPNKQVILVPGHRVNQGDHILSIAPLLTPERDVPTPFERVQMANANATIMSALTVAQGDVERTKAELDAAKIGLDRAAKLLEDRVGSAKAVDDAKAQYNIASTSLIAAQQRFGQLKQLSESLAVDGDPLSNADPLIVSAPQAGLIRNMSVFPGQTVNIGAALFELVSTDSVWIRVPIYVGLLDSVSPDSLAAVVRLDGQQPSTSRNARPIVAPPSADPVSSTADLFYEADNLDGSLRPGQRVGVEITMVGDGTEQFVVPAKSLLYDIYGGTWIYEKVGERAFQRRRVLVKTTNGENVVLLRSPPVGTEIVVDGVAELYGTEFGAGK